MEDTPVLLHGTLHASIFHATRTQPNSSCLPSFPFKCFFGGEQPAYVTIKLDKTKLAKSTHQHNRTWNQSFRILCAHSVSTLLITLRTPLTVLGTLRIPARRLQASSPLEGLFPLDNSTPRLDLSLHLHFTPADAHPHWSKGFSAFPSLASASFPQRSGCGVRLYQDAHLSSSFAVTGRHWRLWEDVYRAIDGAKHLVYIAGWSLNTKTVLVRDLETDVPGARGVSVGELLKRKADEGVAVRVMLWDDETSLRGIKNSGVMRTHDEDAFAYFKHSKVVCRLCPRVHAKAPAVFAHHQKTIVADDAGRALVSFVGGVDLCDGRYDTEAHSLFRGLNDTGSYARDFYQTNIADASLHRGGPREPWHDAHARITGPAAWDVLSNFEQRWRKQCDPSLLVSIEALRDLLIHHDDNSSRDYWNVQVFRSIDHASAGAFRLGHPPVECSIHEAYIEAIRRASKFIYIENQYFIGGCHMWETDKHCGCKNLIPVEIGLKVAAKIRAGERFAAYIVIPMWPEGVPDSEPVQDILHWTRLTMQMMYGLVAEALSDVGGGMYPTDYLNFFCLANRERESVGEFVAPHSPNPHTPYWNAQKHRRFMVYVHSKVMIVDDEFILIGSANVNQRSMDGKRDTEIAVGCYQPRRHECGDVGAYRKSLWYEHTRCSDESFMEPHSVECVRKVCSIGNEMWRVFSGKDVVDMEGVHLVKYPIMVAKNGEIEDTAEGNGTFPDTKTPIKGKRSKILPPLLTT
ncbi:hypothetical protein AMTRI_Chr06g174810 [Amborella trichopoda]